MNLGRYALTLVVVAPALCLSTPLLALQAAGQSVQVELPPLPSQQLSQLQPPPLPPAAPATGTQLQPPPLPPAAPATGTQLQPPPLPPAAPATGTQLQPPPLPNQPTTTGGPAQPPANPLGPPAPPQTPPQTPPGQQTGTGGPPGNVPIELQIIGFDVDDTTKAQLEEAAKAGGGKYYSAGSEQELTQAMGQATGLGTGAPVTTNPATRQAVNLVLDASNSMWGQIQGRAKIEIARDAIRTLLSTWDPNADLGLMAYGHNRPADCTDIETLMSVAPLDANAFNTLVGNLTPKGKTPLTAAVRKAAEELSITDRPASVILFSDGIETCGGDPCALAQELERMGVNFTAHVVGFSTSANEKQLACLAEATGGLYLSADTEQQLTQALQTVANRVANPVATDLITLEAIDQTSGQPITSGVVWTVTSLASEDAVPLTAGVTRPELPLAPGQYVAEARVGTVVGRAQFEVVAKQAQTVQVRLGVTSVPQQAGTCGEPNNDFSAPASVSIAGGIRDNILPTGDADFCAVDVPAPGVLSITASAAPDPLEVVVRVNDIDRTPVRDWSSELLPGAVPVEADLPEAGRYVLEVADAYHDQSAPDQYALNLAFTPVVDMTEPNQSLTRPATLPLGTPVQVAIFPKGERNFLAVEVEDHGELTLTATGVPQPIEVAMRLYGPNHEIVHDWQAAPAGVNNTMVVDLPGPGRYVLELGDSYDDARSPQPLSLTASFVASVDASEPNNSTAQATALAFDTPVQFTILPKGDNDFFGFDAAHRGHLVATATGIPNIEVAMRLYDADRNVVKEWATAPAAGVDLAFEADLPTAGHYWLQVTDSYEDQRSVQPSSFKISLQAADDAMEPNDRPRDAKPLPLGTPVQASILPKGDHDFFTIDAAGGTSLTVRAESVPQNLEVNFRLLDRNLSVVQGWTGPPAAGVKTEMKVDIPTQGRYFLQVVDGYDDASSPAAFTLTATQP